MRVWIDQDCCTGAGLCVDHCPELFVVLDDGIGYVHVGLEVVTDPEQPSVPVPRRYERSAIDAVERCPGECIFLEPDDAVAPDPAGDTVDDIIDADVIERHVGVSAGPGRSRVEHDDHPRRRGPAR